MKKEVGEIPMRVRHVSARGGLASRHQRATPASTYPSSVSTPTVFFTSNPWLRRYETISVAGNAGKNEYIMTAKAAMGYEQRNNCKRY